MQILKGDDPIATDQGVAELMMKITPLIGHPLMLYRHAMSRFVSIATPLLLAAQPSLPDTQQPFMLSQVARVLYLVPSRQGEKVGQSQINAHIPIGWSRRSFILTQDRNEVPTTLGSRNRTGLHLSLRSTVQNNTYPTDFGQVDLVAR
jgi:hypothetical protein